MMEERKTANMADLTIGQRVTALRMSNKAVMIAGTIDALNDDGQTVVVKAVDAGGQEFLETVHAADVMPLPLETEAREHNTVADAAAAGKSFTTVNGKPI